MPVLPSYRNQSIDLLQQIMNQYNVQFDIETMNESFSATPMDLLGELIIGKLPHGFLHCVNPP